MTPRAALERGAEQLGIELPGDACAQLMAYTALLAKWNRSYSLTAVREPLTVVSHHLLDSLAVLPHLPLETGDERVVDAGSGAGLPGIPLALARPRWRVVLAEASQKKAAFLRQAKIELGLDNVEVHEGRVEAWQPALRARLVISRAFSDLADFVSACRHLLEPGGWLAAMKGKHPRAEIARLPRDARCDRVVRLQVPFLEAERHLVLCGPAT